MLSKKKKDMHLSFRNDPRDIFNLQNEVRVNVRRELAKLKCNDGKVDTDSIEKLTMELNDVSIESMTSIDFSNDTRAHFRSHEGQIRDIIYTKKCWKAICCNRHLFKNKIVLDVNCDVGILSMFSAIAGAKHVYAIDTSNITQITRRIMADNGLAKKITIIKGKVSEITLPVDKVDVIVSMSFGQTLFLDNCFDELIDARNKWLASDGLMFPDQCTIYIAAINNKVVCDRSNYWEHVFTFNMRPMIEVAKLEPYLHRIEYEQVVTNGCPIKHMNMYTVEKRDYRRFDAPFCLEGRCNAYIGAFITYFDITFSEGVKPITFTTQPGWYPTIWKPMVFFLAKNDFRLDRFDEFYGVFRFNALSDDYRQIDWNIEIMHEGKHCKFRECWAFESR